MEYANLAERLSKYSEKKLIINSIEQTVQLSVKSEMSVCNALDTTVLRVRAACGGMGSCGACLIQIIKGQFNQPTLVERQKILPDDLAIGMRLACQLYALSDGELFIQYPAQQSDWKSMSDYPCYQSDKPFLGVSQFIYGVAVDLGTTEIRLSLWNRKTGRRIASRHATNPQVNYGADVLTRLDADQLALGKLARKAIITGIRDILSRDMGEVSPILREIGLVVIVGNTAMLMLICGDSSDGLHQPNKWQQSIICQPIDANDWCSSWHMPHVQIQIAQPLAGFVGSDLLADLLATKITEQTEPMILADFGTNTEIAVWDGHTVWVSSVPGGPAFEGVGLSNGLMAEAGAIYQVFNGQYQTIAQTLARGYCASGYVDVIAQLVADKVVKISGRFVEPLPQTGFRLESNNANTAVYTRDIDTFQRAKAATAAAMIQLLSLSGLRLTDLKRFYLCGNFGKHLNLTNAIALGLLPNIPINRIFRQTNASLAGCEKLLLQPESQELVNSISDQARVINFANSPTYDEIFIENLRLQPMIVAECR